MRVLKHITLSLMVIAFLSLATSCSKSDNVEPEKVPIKIVSLDNEINDFVWLGLNEIYLWQNEVPNLADTKADNRNDYFTFLNSYDTPEKLFDGLLYKKDEVDRDSWIVDDYTVLENFFQGNSNSNGLDMQLGRIGDSNDLFGFIRYVANDSDASTKDIKRGDFFMTVNDQQLTIDNYVDLLFGENNSYTLGMATVTSGSIDLNDKKVSLTKTDFTENPILINKVIETNGIKVGYLMLNQFVNSTEGDLNDNFADLKAQGITELVLDLRYNGGGHGTTANAISSMITGQFNGEVFKKTEWNPKYQAYWEANNPDFLIDRFSDKLNDGTPISSLNLTKIYILTTEDSASSSELVLNGLDPYIDVVQIGTTTYGKYVGSYTLYDSPTLTSKENVNPNHKYAMQPIAVKSLNANGVTDYINGIAPDHVITYQTNSGSILEGENILNLGVLGDENEPFLAKALSLITNGTTKIDYDKLVDVKGLDVKFIASSKEFTPLGKGMLPIIETFD